MNQLPKTNGQRETARPAMPHAISIAILAMGGEGGGVLADWIVDLAEHAGYCAQTTSVPGVAQRTGATIYYVEIFPDALVRALGREPVLALMPVPGEVDLVIASELMEAGRAVQRGLVTPDKTTLIASTHRVYSMTEKTAANDGRVNAEKLREGCQRAAKNCVLRDFARIASESRSVISATLFGALAATKALPFQREQFEDAIRRGGVGIDSSLEAFGAGFDAAIQDPAALTGSASSADKKSAPGANLADLAARLKSRFPAPSHEILGAGILRLTDYQDKRYSEVYLDRLEKVREADQQFGDGNYRLLCECGRFLALWMSYEDAIRVADLKIRLARFERVGQDSQTRAGQLLQIHEFLYPRVQEITDILPKKLGRWLLRSGWPKRFLTRVTEGGRVVQTTSLRGFLQLYFIASLRRWRRNSLRFVEEQEKIEAWLARVEDLARKDYALACEVAEFPRVLRGYGETHARGRSNFDAMMAAVPRLVQRADAPVRLKRLCEAALADESGQRLQAVLLEVTA
ncbi:MAG: indolepyruvate oxidoreductase subunit beta family protein [Candidatus Acidiferrum sp.]